MATSYDCDHPLHELEVGVDPAGFVSLTCTGCRASGLFINKRDHRDADYREPRHRGVDGFTVWVVDDE